MIKFSELKESSQNVKYNLIKFLEKQDNKILVEVILNLYNNNKKMDKSDDSSLKLSENYLNTNSELISKNKSKIIDSFDLDFFVNMCKTIKSKMRDSNNNLNALSNENDNNDNKLDNENENEVKSKIFNDNNEHIECKEVIHAEKTDLEIKKEKISNIDFSKTKNVAFSFLYFGKNYDGMVMQNSSKNTIEETILNCFIKVKLIKDIESCKFSRCGRTDKGVNSFFNVFNLEVRDIEFDYLKVINRLLPIDIKLIGFSNVDYGFDSRFNCIFREYKYFFMRKNLNIEKMKEGAKKLLGEHNFFNFCKIDRSKILDDGTININFNRKIYEIEIVEYKAENTFFDIFYLYVKGSAFLWHQIRCIMAVLFLIGEEKEEVNIIDNLLQENNYHFNYSIASEETLILSNCQFEGVNFDINSNIKLVNPKVNDSVSTTFFIFSQLCELYEKAILDCTLKKFMLEEYSKLIIENNNDLSIKKSEIDINTALEIYKIDFPDIKVPNKYTQLLKRKRDNKMVYKVISESKNEAVLED